MSVAVVVDTPLAISEEGTAHVVGVCVEEISMLSRPMRWSKVELAELSSTQRKRICPPAATGADKERFRLKELLPTVLGSVLAVGFKAATDVQFDPPFALTKS